MPRFHENHVSLLDSNLLHPIRQQHSPPPLGSFSWVPLGHTRYRSFSLLQHIMLSLHVADLECLLSILYFCVDNNPHACAQWVFCKYLPSVFPLTSNSPVLGNKIQVLLDIL